MAAEDVQRYNTAAHAMQSGVAYEMHNRPRHDDWDYKDLRTGVNSALVNDAGLARLLIDKGVFTSDEYERYIADEMEREVKRYETRNSGMRFL